MSSNSRIAIVGAGPVGLACALALAQLRNAEVTLIDRQLQPPPSPPLGHAVIQDQSQTPLLGRGFDGVPLPGVDQFDHRVYAIAPSSKSLLERLGVWSRMESARIEAVRAMRIFGDGVEEVLEKSLEKTSEKYSLNLTHGTPLAYIVEHAALMQALHAELSARANIRLLDGTLVSAISGESAPRLLTLGNGVVIEADLVIAADGSMSPLRELVDISASSKDYESDGVVANFRITQPHLGVARQWFSDLGVLAYLPLPNNHMSIVFSVAKGYADELMAMAEPAFAEAIGQAGHGSLGALTLASTRACFPLKRIMAQHWVQAGFALVGDAAHAIHPLAGQGANLGFADVACLADTLLNRSSLSVVGDLAVLRRYERARREDAATMGEVTDGLRGLYLNPAGWAKRVRNDGLGLLEKMPLAKSLLVGHVVG
jgi:2-polyprenylphenol 6-hydroxylase